jgi:hypothetical protein
MPKRTGTPKNRPDKGLDVSQNARRVVLESISETETVTVSMSLVSQVMAAMGRKGGKTGGKRRMELLTAEQRSEMGKAAAEKRWGKNRKAKK